MQATATVFLSIKRLLPQKHAVHCPRSWEIMLKVNDSCLSLLCPLSLHDCGNGEVFSSFFYHYRQTSGLLAVGGSKIKTSTGAEGPQKAKGGPCGALKGHNKAQKKPFPWDSESAENKGLLGERLSVWVHLWKGPLPAHIAMKEKETAYYKK